MREKHIVSIIAKLGNYAWQPRVSIIAKLGNYA
jgi:hypothetical protein